MEAEAETMSSVLASVSTRKEKAAKAMAALHSHRNLITACITDWENLEKSFGVTERTLQQKFKELAERETAYDAKVEEARAALRKREESIAGREEVSLAHVKEQKDTAMVAIVEERRKFEEERAKWREEKGISEAQANALVNLASKTKAEIEKPLADQNAAKDVAGKGTLKQDPSKAKASKSSKDGQQKKVSAGGSSSKNESGEAARKEIMSSEKRKDKEVEVAGKKDSEIKEEKKQISNQEQSSKSKRKDGAAEDEAAAKRRKEGPEPDVKAGADIRKGDAVKNAPSLEDAIKIVRLAADVPVPMQIKLLMEEQDFEGLKEFFVKNRKDIQKLRPDLQAALQASKDPCRLTLKILEVSEGPERICESNKRAHGCIFLLECLSDVVADPVLGVDFPVVPSDVKDIARSMARRWKALLESGNQDNYALSSHLFLQLLASFGIGTDYTADDLLKYVVFMSRRGVGPGLCRTLGLSEKIPVVVDKLIAEGKQIDAIGYAAAFGLLGKYNIKALFRSFLDDSQKKFDTDKAAVARGNANELYSKQIVTLKNAIKVLEDHKLDGQLPVENVHNQISELKKERAAMKKADANDKQEVPPDKGPIEQSGIPNGASASHRKEDPVFHSYLDSGREMDGTYFSSFKRGEYVTTDMGRAGRMDYTPTDIGKPLFPSFSLDRFNTRPDSTGLDRFSMRPDSAYDKYGIGGRSSVPLSSLNPFPSREAIGSFSRNPGGSLPGAGFQSYGGIPRDDSRLMFPPSRGKLPFPEGHVQPSNYPTGTGLPPSSGYLPYFR